MINSKILDNTIDELIKNIEQNTDCSIIYYYDEFLKHYCLDIAKGDIVKSIIFKSKFEIVKCLELVKFLEGDK